MCALSLCGWHFRSLSNSCVSLSSVGDFETLFPFLLTLNVVKHWTQISCTQHSSLAPSAQGASRKAKELAWIINKNTSPPQSPPSALPSCCSSVCYPLTPHQGPISVLSCGGLSVVPVWRASSAVCCWFLFCWDPWGTFPAPLYPWHSSPSLY